VAAFALAIVALSLAFSAVAWPVCRVAGWELSWWAVVRRCVSVASMVVLWAMLRFVHRQSFGSLGFGPWRAGKAQLLQGVAWGAGVLAVLAAGYVLTGVWRFELHPDRARVIRTVVGFLPAAGLVAVLEEAIFRGYLLQQLLVCSKAAAVTISSAAYALVHLRPPAIRPDALPELCGLFLLGVVLSLAYFRTRQLYLPVGLHAVFAYGAQVNKKLFVFAQGAPSWLVGTSRLVNGVVTWLALAALGYAIARHAWTRAEKA
jgi:membrane protease YdiL (CAAX protease family)